MRCVLMAAEIQQERDDAHPKRELVQEIAKEVNQELARELIERSAKSWY